MRRSIAGLVALVVGLVVLPVAAPLDWDRAEAATPVFVPIQPDRLIDTRAVGPQNPTVRRLGPGQQLTLNAWASSRVPTGATGVALNVTAVRPSNATFVTVWPAHLGRPNASNLNPTAGRTVPNAVVTGLSPDGRFRVYNDKGDVDILVDVTGYFTGGFNGVAPTRLMDTRTNLGGSRLAGPDQRNLKVAGVAGVPADAVAVVVNVTATRATAPSFVTVWPTAQARPGTSNLNFGPSQTIPNAVVVRVGAGGQISIFNDRGSVDVLVDIMGYLDATAGFVGLNPARVMDTRQVTCGAHIAGGETRVLKVAGTGGVPASGAGAVVLNVTATRASASSFVAVWPTGAAQPATSNLNFIPGQTVPNTVIVGVGAGGQVSITNGAGGVDVIVDVMGYFGGTTPPGATVPCPKPAGGSLSAPVLLYELQQLTVAPEQPRTGYDRNLFAHWNDTNGSGCNARQDALNAQVFGTPTRTNACTITSGTWYSLFDAVTVTGSPSQLDIDHVVPLAEAWDSGANTWSSTQRRAFANDPIHLLAVTASINRSKGDRDAGEWKPPQRSSWCITAAMTVRAKAKYQLTIDPTEKSGLIQMAQACDEAGQRTVPGLPHTGGNVALPPLTPTTPPPTEPPPPTTPPPTQPPPTTQPPASCVNINTASWADLQQIVHIGPERATELISLRPFASVDDMTRINGIGPARLTDIKNQGLACV